MWFAIAAVAALLVLMLAGQVSVCRQYNTKVADSRYARHAEGVSVQETLRSLRRRAIAEAAERQRRADLALREITMQVPALALAA